MEKYQNKYRIQSNRLPKWDYSSNGAYFITICVNNKNYLFGSVEQGKMILNDFGQIAHHEWEISAQIRKEIELDIFVIMPNHMHGIVIINKSNIDGPHVETHGPHVETHGPHVETHGPHVETHGPHVETHGPHVETHGPHVETHGPHVETHGPHVETHGPHVETHGPHVETHGPHVETHGPHVETHGRVSLQQQSQPNQQQSQPNQQQSQPNQQQSQPNQQQSQPNQPQLHRKPKSISSFIAGYKSSVTTKINNLIHEYVQTHGHDYYGIEKFNRKNKLWQPNYYDHIIRDEAEYNRIRTYIIENPQKWEQDKFYK
jgi:putative transposase